MKDPYKILGVSPKATQEEIKKAYRKLALELHPDSDPDNPWAEDEFKELSAAYNLLSNAETRKRYDRGEIDGTGAKRHYKRPAGGPRTQGGPRRSSANPFDEFFRQRAAREASDIKVRGANVTYTLNVDFLEAANGVTKRVGMTTGKRLDVFVPPGTEDGQTLRLKGQGMLGIGHDAGDALVTIKVTPHPVFRRNGDDIHIEIPISLPEAVLGGKIEVPTIGTPVSVKIPADSNTGTQLRLKGKGIRRNGENHGDQYVKLHIVLPDKPNHQLTEFVKSWAGKYAYNVRSKKTTVN